MGKIFQETCKHWFENQADCPFTSIDPKRTTGSRTITLNFLNGFLNRRHHGA